jgi:hypothetical protein
MDSEIQKITKRISILKYDLKKLTCKGDDWWFSNIQIQVFIFSTEVSNENDIYVLFS